MSEWKKVKLGEVCITIQPGPFGTQLHNSDYTVEGIPVIMPKDMYDGRIRHDKLEYVSEETVERISRHKVAAGDILVARKGDVRKCVFITQNEKGWITGSDCLKVVLQKEHCTPKFIYYQLKNPYIGAWMQQISKGATMPSLNTSLLSSIEISLPPLSTQHRIATILSRYDSLIENYQKQIKLLEEAAQRLYKEWFIDLRFPGHENANIVDGVPEGWEKKKVGELLIKQIGGGWGKDTPTGSYDVGGHVIRGTDISQIENGHMAVPYRYHMESNLKDRRLKEGDIIFEVSGGSANEPVGRTLFITNELVSYFGGNTICASFCKKMSFRMISESVIAYYTIRYFRGIGYLHKYEKDSAGKIINYNWNDFLNEFDILLPNQDMLGNISTRLQKFITEASKLKSQLRLLTEARDRLLPKLMSGEIEV